MDAEQLSDMLTEAQEQCPTCSPDSMLADDYNNMRKAGCHLAMAAMRVCTEYDGVHRLLLAISEWTKTLANTGRRGGGQ